MHTALHYCNMHTEILLHQLLQKRKTASYTTGNAGLLKCLHDYVETENFSN